MGPCVRLRVAKIGSIKNEIQNPRGPYEYPIVGTGDFDSRNT